MTSVFFMDLRASVFIIRVPVSLAWLVISHLHLIELSTWQSSSKAHVGINEVRN